MGVLFVASFFVVRLNKEWRVDALMERAGRGGPIVAGAAFAIAWTPCIGPTLAAILSAAALTDSAAKGAGLLAVYSLGLGVPFLLTAIAFTRMTTAFDVVKRHYAAIIAVGGVILIAMGVLVFTGEFFQLNIEAQKLTNELRPGLLGAMRKNPYYELTDLDEIRRLIRENPWATLVSQRVTRPRRLALSGPARGGPRGAVDRHPRRPAGREGARARRARAARDRPGPSRLHLVELVRRLRRGPDLELHRRSPVGRARASRAEENFEVLTPARRSLRATMSPSPRPLDATPEVAEDARRDSRGTIGLRLVPTRIVAKRKMSQNKPPEIVETVIGELEGDGPYASEALAREMRLVHDPDSPPG